LKLSDKKKLLTSPFAFEERNVQKTEADKTKMYRTTMNDQTSTWENTKQVMIYARHVACTGT
jgi:hypothetical protein